MKNQKLRLKEKKYETNFNIKNKTKYFYDKKFEIYLSYI